MFSCRLALAMYYPIKTVGTKERCLQYGALLEKAALLGSFHYLIVIACATLLSELASMYGREGARYTHNSNLSLQRDILTWQT